MAAGEGPLEGLVVVPGQRWTGVTSLDSLFIMETRLLKNTRMLVLGASGFIGRHTVQRALEAGWQVDAVAHSSSKKDNFAQAGDGPTDRLRVRSGFDITDHGAVESLVEDRQPDVVVHAAAIGARPGHYATTGIVRDNVVATSILLDVCRSQDIGRVVLFGSGVCYGPSLEPHTENEPLQPESDYGLAKTICAEIAAYQNRTGYDRVIELRPFNIYGPDDYPKRLIPYIIAQAMANQPVELTSGEQKRDFVYVQDVVDTVLAAADGEVPAGAYNVATQEPVAVSDVARLIISLVASTSALRLGAVSERSDRHQCLSGRVDRLKALGLAPKTTLRDGLLATIEATRSVVSPASS